ncbi:PARI protein, partial [Panurus biarmicus]|nr:PARI protein [Panurus biarmicus]
MGTFQQKMLHLVKCFRKQWPLFCNSERTTVCGADCMLMALQLSMAEVNKQHHGDFTVSLSDVLEMWNYLLHDKLGLYESMKEPGNYADDCLCRLSCVYVWFCNYILLYTYWGMRRYSIAGINFLVICSSVNGLFACNKNCKFFCSGAVLTAYRKVTILAKKSVCSYLSLLVNSKDDLALAHILNVPDRGLGREAFTNLKRVSQERKMSIFLMATSFIRTIELGGRDSASSLYDPLRAHVKGLSSFVNFIDKLQEIVGEILNTRMAGGRILSTVKMHLIKGRSNGDPFCRAVEEVLQDLDLKIKNIIDSQQETLTASTTGVSPAR